MTLTHIGRRVKQARLAKRPPMTQKALAARVGVHRVYLVQIETGTKVPSLGLLQKIAKALGVTLEDLVKS